MIRVPVEGAAAMGLAQLVEAKGGRWTMETTSADHRSLNRALHGGLSCYSFRHQTGSDLKGDIAAGVISPEEAAAVMGHRSTGSLSAYGNRSKARGGRRLRGNAIAVIRTVPVSFEARAEARGVRAKASADDGRLRADPSPQVRRQGASTSAAIKAPRRPKPPRM